MRINYTIPNFTFAVGGLDCTKYIDSINLNAPQSEMSGMLLWGGDFELSFNRRAQADGLTAADFDPLQTPNRWRQGLAVVALSIEGFAFPRLRIERYVYDPQTRKGKGVLAQILELLSGDRPATEPEFEVGEERRIALVVDKLIQAGYSGTGLTLNPRVLSGLEGFIDSAISTRDPIDDAQKLCAANWQWLAVDNQERVITVSGVPSDRPLVFSRGLNQIEWEPDLDAIHFAAEKVIVTGSRQVIDLSRDCSDQPDNPNIDAMGRPRVVTTQSFSPYSSLFPPGPTPAPPARPPRPNLTPTLAEEKTILYDYRVEAYYGTVYSGSFWFRFNQPADIQGMESDLRSANSQNCQDIDVNTPIKTMTIIDRPLGAVFPDLGAITTLITAEVQIETPFLRATYKPRGSIVEDPTIPKTSQRRLELVLERREQLKDPRASLRPDHGGKNPNTGKPQCLEQGPELEQRQFAPDVRLKTEPIKAEANVRPTNWVPLIKRPYTQDIGFCPSEEHAAKIANQIALREAARRDTVQITMPLPREWMAAGFPLLARCRIHDAEFLMDGPIVSITEGQAKFSFAGSRVGSFSPAIADPVPPAPYIPTGAMQLLLPTTPITTTAGQPMQPVQLAASSIGVGVLVFSSPNLLPGLTLTPAGLLSGTPNTTATFTISVTDGVSTVNAPLTVTAAAAPIVTPPIIGISEFVSGARSALIAVEVPVTIVLGSRSLLEPVTPPVVPPAPPSGLLASRGKLMVYPNPGFSTGTIAPRGDYGLAEIMSGEDDSNVVLPDLGFDFFVYGVNRRNDMFAGSNSWITFGSGSSSTSPSGPGLFIAAGDRYAYKIYAGPDGFNRYRVRWEGSRDFDGASINRFWEAVFFANGTIMVVTGDFLDPADGPSYLSDGTLQTAILLAANSSWVFTQTYTPLFQITYNVTTGSYS